MGMTMGGSICRLSEFQPLASDPMSAIGRRSTPMLPFWAHLSTPAPSGGPVRALDRAPCAKLRPCSALAMQGPMTTRTMPSICRGMCGIVDIGDADIIHTNTVNSHANIETGVRAILAAGALPVTIGGDHSVNIPCINAFDAQGDFHILQIDAHLDFVDERHGVRFGHGNPMRRAAEKSYVTGLTQVGIRNVSSTAKEGYDAARAMGSDIVSVRQSRALGAKGTGRPYSTGRAGLCHP